jgi:hypothetical protein
MYTRVRPLFFFDFLEKGPSAIALEWGPGGTFTIFLCLFHYRSVVAKVKVKAYHPSGGNPVQMRAWADRPSVELGFFVVASPRPNFPLTVVALGEPQGCWTHWLESDRPGVRGRCKPHWDTECPYCKRGISSRYRHFLPSLRPKQPGDREGTERRTIVEITNGAALQLGDELEFRGQILTFRRQGKQNNSPVKIDLCERWADVDSLPAAFDVRLSLLRMWGELNQLERSTPDKSADLDVRGNPILNFDRALLRRAQG